MSENIKFRELAIGKTLYNGKYVIEKVLGIGGFGITYYAKHSILDTYYAIKEFFISGYCVRSTQTRKIHLHGIEEEVYEKFRQKFVEEAQTLINLDHLNIVKVIDIFEENDTSYIVMPFIEGKTLQQLVEEQGKLEYEIAVNYIAQLSEAIAYIHKNGILHRDIKPDNIMLTPDNRVVLIDFGSAREFIHDKTQSHTAILTKGYAPLEQYSSVGRKGAYSDIYSLGAVFYFSLTGQKPLDAPARTMDAMPEPKDLVPSILKEANFTIMKAMQLNIEDRYQQVSEFMDDLLGKRKRSKFFGTKKKKLRYIIVVLFLLSLVSGAILLFDYMNIFDNETDNNQLPTFGISNIIESPIADTIPTPETEQKADTDWLIQYEQALAEANKLFYQNEYKKARSKYKNILSIIPSTDNSNKKREIEKKISDCNRLIKDLEDEELRQREIEIAQQKIEEENILQAKRIEEQRMQEDLKRKEDLQKEQARIAELKETLVKANDAFKAAQYDKAFELYKEVQKLNPGDNTGYSNFIKKAKEIIPYVGYDPFVKKLLSYAQKLNPSGKEAAKLLSNYN